MKEMTKNRWYECGGRNCVWIKEISVSKDDNCEWKRWMWINKINVNEEEKYKKIYFEK